MESYLQQFYNEWEGRDLQTSWEGVKYHMQRWPRNN
jgi:hypothetical protein